MITISLCMIVKNEEVVISKCLSSAKSIVDEIIIVDTGSTDKTKEICSEFTDKIYDFAWIDDFSAARNYSFSKATMEYILWLDADDIILDQDIQKLLDLKLNLNPSIDAVRMKYNYSGTDENGNNILSFFRERLSKRVKKFKWFEPVHEYLDVSGNIENFDICITHKKEVEVTQGRNLFIYEKNISQGKILNTTSLYYYARELYNNNKTTQAIQNFTLFLNKEDGWVEDKIWACNLISRCYSSINDLQKSLFFLHKSFEYDLPRAENCCEIGNCYFYLEQYDKAIFWYKLALEVEKPAECLGFIMSDYFGYVPHLQLCVCYDKLGKRQEAIKHNIKAGECKPNDKVVLENMEYFKNYYFQAN